MIEFYAAKPHRWVKVPMHPVLGDRLSVLKGKTGDVFDYRNWRSMAFEFGRKIREFKPDKSFRPVGGHTPRHSLGSYLRNEARWRWEDIQQFLTHVIPGDTRRYTHDSIELLREMVDRLPFR